LQGHLLTWLRAAGIFLGAGPVLAQSCDQLWYARNAIFKEAGYCFRTSRAIQRFGNAGCQYDSEYDVPLSERQRREVNEIKSAERRFGCR
jgi:hypothetical protein